MVESSGMIVIVVGAAILAFVIFFELRYMRSRKREKIEMILQRDEAYNALITTSAVSKTLKEKNKDTSEADSLIIEAERAYQRKDYLVCKELTERAREALRRAKSKDLDVFEEISSKPTPQEEEQIPPFQEVKKLPVNYIESKFMIESAQMGIEAADQRGVDTTAAKDYLESARRCFERTEYTNALKFAYKAKRCAEGQVVEQQVKVAEQSVKEEIEAKDEPRAKIEIGMVGNEQRCSSCGDILHPNDNFCGKCGAKVRKIIRCPSCALEAESTDNFCRKCGTRLKST
ncbi:MAG: zinc ribbon domain-containing protein [Methanomassiliicoccales archaeon]